jgi:UDP-N-acetylmuramate--alanine ligase
MINFNNIKHVHFIGIGGIGNSAIAEILMNLNIKVSGSDLQDSKITRKLNKKGATIFKGHDKANIKKPDLIVYSSAINENNEERLEGKKLKIREVNRAEILGALMDTYSTSIAVSGTHGKTTTTSMITNILKNLNLDPTSLIGGNLESISGNVLIGNSNILITEACEYKENFLHLKPTYGIILNIEEDHLDYYDDLEHIINTFIKFSKNIKPDGALIVNNDDYNTKRIHQYINTKIITIGINQKSDFQAKNITFDDYGNSTFDIFNNEKLLTKCTLSVPGMHNIYNALSAIALSTLFEEDINRISMEMTTFKGVHRRFENMGKCNGALVIDDYAHHPTEIKATLSTARKLEQKKIISIFQPHTYSRTKELLSEFATSFTDSDEIIITNIYAAREENVYNISSLDLVNEIKKYKKNVKYIGDLEECENYLRNIITSDKLVIILGAGDIRTLSENLVK